MKRAFTLLELLIVIGIMGLMGTISVGAYRAMQRGMTERGVMDNVNSFIRAAYQRAQIDGQPTTVYFWNETVRQADETHTLIAVGHAVAVRRHSRLTRVDEKFLYDEFGDLNLLYTTDGEDQGDAENTLFLYPMDSLSSSNGKLPRSAVHVTVYQKPIPIRLPSLWDNPATDQNQSEAEADLTIDTYAFQVQNMNGVNWKAGMTYGFEFATLDLPRNYIFGSVRPSDSADSPIQEVGTLSFTVGGGSSMGIQVSSLRPNSRGELAPANVGKSMNPTEQMK